MSEQSVAEVGVDGNAIFVHFEVHVADSFVGGLADDGRDGFVWKIIHYLVGRSHGDCVRRCGVTSREGEAGEGRSPEGL